MPWRDWQSDLESHYNPRAVLPGFATYVAAYQALSAASGLSPERDIAYGEDPLQNLDAYPAAAGAAAGGPRPIWLFIHGGYWRSLDKKQFAFAAAPAAQAGYPAVLLNYRLCPAVSLDDLVADVLDGIAFVQANAARFGGDGRIWLAGHSVGAHLAAMALGHDWQARGIDPAFLLGATLLTGIYDVEPVRHISVNDDVRLDEAAARRNSPLYSPPKRPLPLLIAAGGAEPEGWIAQSTDYAAACRAAGAQVDERTEAGENHFSIALSLGDPNHSLTRRTFELMAASQQSAFSGQRSA